MIKRAVGSVVVLGLLLTLPSHLAASPWYGWDHVCSVYGGDGYLSPFSVCTSVQILTEPSGAGGSTVSIRMRYTSSEPVAWGGPRYLRFRTAEESHPGWPLLADHSLLYYLFAEPSAGTDWSTLSFEAPFTIRHTDLRAFYSELYNFDELIHSPPFTTFEVSLRDPRVVAPEPSTVALLATGLLLMGFVRTAHRRRER